MTNTAFPGFSRRRVQVAGAEINAVVGGAGPPLLLLHGYPQTHLIWHKIAGRLAERFSGKNHAVLDIWRSRAGDVRGTALDCGHFLPEERPEATLAALTAFFSA